MKPILILYTILATQSYMFESGVTAVDPNCKPSLQIRTCDTDPQEGVAYRRTFYFYVESVNVKIGCPNDTISKIEWKLYSDATKSTKTYSKGNNKAMLAIDAKEIEIGRYTWSVVATESTGLSTTATCQIEYIPEPPFGVFREGELRYIRPGEEYTVNVSVSKTYEKAPLKIEWEAKCKPRRGCECEDLSGEGLVFKKKHKLCQKSIRYDLKLTSGPMFTMAAQYVKLTQDQESTVNIKCLKNCNYEGAAFANPKQTAMYEVRCIYECNEFEKITPVWTVTGTDKQQKPGPVPFTQDRMTISIPATSLKEFEDENIRIKVNGQGTGMKYRSEVYLAMREVMPPPPCDISPKSGKSLETVFIVVCTPDPQTVAEGPYFKLTQPLDNSEEGYILTESPFLKFATLIGAIKGKSQQTLKLSGRTMLDAEFSLDLQPITVTSDPLTNESIERHLKHIEELNKLGDTTKAIQLAQGLVSEIKDSALSEDDKSKALAKLVKHLADVTVDNVYTYKQIGGTVAALSGMKDMSTDFREQLSGLCKSLGHIQTASLAKTVFPGRREFEVKRYSENLNKCADSIFEPNKNDKMELSTPDTVSELGITEEYKDYDDAYINPQMERIRANAMDTIVEAAKAIGSTLKLGENYTASLRNAASTVKVDAPSHINPLKVKGAEVQVKLGTDPQSQAVSAVITSFDTKILQNKNADIATNIVDVQFFKYDRVVGEPISRPFDILLSLERNELDWLTFTISIPKHNSSVKMEYHMNVHRLDLFRSSSCHIRFKDITATTKLKAVLTESVRPRIVDFKNKPFIISENYQELKCPATHQKEDRFIYLGILPHEDMFLLGYVVREHLMINCSCSHMSLFAARQSVLPSKLDKINLVTFNASKFVNYIVLIHVAIIFCCYCIALCFMQSRTQEHVRKANIIFLTDNLKNDRYAYLITIKTGHIPSAGTTANVIIQIFGEHTDTKPHVLNYPDPEKRLLQRNKNDWFVLANDRHLGDIRYINVWFDNIGLYPTWFCEYIIIIDLQTHERWFFDIQQWLNINSNKTLEIIAQPTILNTKRPSLLFTIRKNLRCYPGAEHTWNIFSRVQDDRIKYEHRLTIILSSIYTTYACLMMMVHFPEMKITDAYGYGDYLFYTEISVYAVASSIISCVINIPFAYIFRNSRTFGGDPNLLVFKSRKFSQNFAKVTWHILILWIILCMLYLICFGFWVTYRSTYIWMSCTILSLIINVFVNENLYIFLYNFHRVYFSMVYLRKYNFKIILKEVENQRKVLYKTLGEVLMRSYFKTIYQHLVAESIQDMRISEAKREEVRNLFHDMCMFIVFVLLLYIIAFARTDKSITHTNKMMKNMFYGYNFSEVPCTLDSIRTVEDVYKYINNTIIHVVHSRHWYGKFYSKIPGELNDFNSRILGIVQLRQQRREQNCNLPRLLRGLNVICSNATPAHGTWEYDHGADISSTMGTFGWYDGSGYKAVLGRTLYNSYYILNLLKMHKWIDINTKVLFIEFWTYNANNNLFNSIRITIERSKTGRYSSFIEVFTARLIYSDVKTPIVLALLGILLLLIIIVMTSKKILLIIRYGRAYFNSFWNVIDVIIGILSVYIIYIWFHASYAIKKLLNKLVESNHNEFLNHFNLVSLMDTMVLVMAILVCVSTIRLWKFLRFQLVFRMLEQTFWTAVPEFLTTVLCQVIILISCTILIFCTFGSEYTHFSTFTYSLFTLYQISLSFQAGLNFLVVSTKSTTFGLFYAFYIFCSMMFVSIYATIVIRSFLASKKYFSNKTLQYDLARYIRDELKYCEGYGKRYYLDFRHLKAGDDVELPKIYPKEDTFRYDNCFILSNTSLKLMQIAALFLTLNTLLTSTTRKRKLRKLPYNKAILMAKLFLLFALPESNITHKFFKGKEVTITRKAVRTTFVPDHRILLMENLTAYLLRAKEEAFEAPHAYDMKGGEKRLVHIRDSINLLTTTLENIRVIIKTS